MHHRSLYKKAYMRQVKVLTSVEPFIAVLNRQCTDIGIVFHCKHNLMHSYIQSLKPILKILKFKYLQIPHKAYLSPFLVTNWPQRYNLFHENPLTPCPPWYLASCTAPTDFTWNRGYRSKSPPPTHRDQIPQDLKDSDNQIPSSPGRQRCQIWPGKGWWSFDLTDTQIQTRRPWLASYQKPFIDKSMSMAKI